MIQNNRTHRTGLGLAALPAMSAGLLVVGALAAQASTDYGPAVWRPACSSNKYTSGNGHKFLVIHDMEGYYAYCVGTQYPSCGGTDNPNNVSIHYAVNGKKDATSDFAAGEISQTVRESDYAFHARCWNTYSAGTEHEGRASNPAWYTTVMYQNSADLQRHLCDHYGIAKDRNHIVGHDAKSSSAWVSWANSTLGINASCNTHGDPGAYWDWTGFMNLIRTTTPVERIDVFVRGTGANPQIHQKFFPDVGWSDFIGMGGIPAGAPDVCSFAPNRLDLFVRGTNNALQHKSYSGTWSAWESLGGNMSSDPCAVSWGNNRIDVFYLSAAHSNQLVQVFWTSTGGWSAPVPMGGNLIGNPDACSWGANRIDIFGRGADNSLQHKYYNGTWSAWESLGGVLSSDPGCTSWGANRIDVFVVGGTGPQVLQKVYDGSWDANWYAMGGSPNGSPKVCSFQNGRLDILMRGTDNTLQHKYFNDGTWAGWESLGGALSADPGCVSWTTGN